MSDTAVKPLDHDDVTADMAVDDAIRAAGGEREAVRDLLDRLADAERHVSLGYRRGRQPQRPAS